MRQPPAGAAARPPGGDSRASLGWLPDDLLEDEEVLAKLPLVFRTLRGKRLTERQLAELVKKVRGT